MTNQNQKYEDFKTLHESSGAFVIPNPWNAGSAKILASLGFDALATTSAGYAFSIGKNDSSGAISRTEILLNAQEIIKATPLPVSADLENGFGDSAKDCAETIVQAIEIGLVGGSIEDASNGRAAPIYDFNLAVERIAAASEAARGQPFLLTARAENFCYDRPDLDDTIKRLQAFEAAGADVLYAPGLPSLDAIRTVCQSVSKPVNVVMGLSGPNYSVEELSEAGVKRISVGGSLARSALGAFISAATEIKENGSFSYAKTAVSDADANKYMSDKD